MHLPRPRAGEPAGALRRSRGFTILELAIVITVSMTIASLIYTKYQTAVTVARYEKARGDLRAIAFDIDFYAMQYGSLPRSLHDVGRGNLLDPWRVPYMYLNFEAGTGNALDFVLKKGLLDPRALVRGVPSKRPSTMFDEKDFEDRDPEDITEMVDEVKRKDKFLFPLNSDYDLFSLGPDAKGWAQITEDFSLDDVIRANNGGFFGRASEY